MRNFFKKNQTNLSDSERKKRFKKILFIYAPILLGFTIIILIIYFVFENNNNHSQTKYNVEIWTEWTDKDNHPQNWNKKYDIKGKYLSDLFLNNTNIFKIKIEGSLGLFLEDIRFKSRIIK